MVNTSSKSETFRSGLFCLQKEVDTRSNRAQIRGVPYLINIFSVLVSFSLISLRNRKYKPDF